MKRYIVGLINNEDRPIQNNNGIRTIYRVTIQQLDKYYRTMT